MAKFVKLLEFSKPDFISDLQFNQLELNKKVSVWFQVESNNEESKHIDLTGSDDLIESISELLSAEKVIVSREINTNKEFGTIRIELWVDGCYSEFWCDSASTEI